MKSVINIKRQNMFFLIAAVIIASTALPGYNVVFSADKTAAAANGPDLNSREKPAGFSNGASTQTFVAAVSTCAAAAICFPKKPKYVRGAHLTAWVAGSTKHREALNSLVEETEINTFVIDVKEYEGEIYVPGYDKAKQYDTYVSAIPDFEKYIGSLKNKNIYLVARIVVFKDNLLPKKRPDLAVKDSSGQPWKDHAGLTWLDPYDKENWDYNIGLAEHCVKMGFDEVQFDYIRFPSDGNTHNCRYVQQHSSTTASAAIVNFLELASKRLKPLGANVSIDVFGLTTIVSGDMGIGQKIVGMSKWADFVSPMVYPSHYAKGEFGIPDPNKAPYETVYLSLESAKRRIPAAKLRPYLQDFSLGYHYGEKEIREQIQACYDNDIAEWLLWNPRCVYNRQALKPKKFSETYEKLPVPSYIHEKKTHKPVEVSTAAAAGAAVAATTSADTVQPASVALPAAGEPQPKVEQSTTTTTK